jgi:hypothetical protein
MDKFIKNLLSNGEILIHFFLNAIDLSNKEATKSKQDEGLNSLIMKNDRKEVIFVYFSESGITCSFGKFSYQRAVILRSFRNTGWCQPKQYEDFFNKSV